MSPKFWASSDDLDLSVNSSVKSSEHESRDATSSTVGQDFDDSAVEESLGRQNDGTVAKVMGTGHRMPNLQPHQHASLFYLSLIEGRCRTQAANTVNAGRQLEEQLSEDHPEVCALSQHLFTQMSKELVKAGMVPEEFASQNIADLRLYLTSFDTLLSNIATRRNHNIRDQESYRAVDNSEYLALEANSAQSSIELSRARISQQQLIMASNTTQPSLSPFLELLLPEMKKNATDKLGSDYARSYKQLELLGRGGFGRVYRALHYMTNSEYAIKKIVVRAERLNALAQTGKLQGLLDEVKTLALADHHNLVRYYHSWFEIRPAFKGNSDPDSNTGDDFGSDSEDIFDENSDVTELESQIRSVHLTAEHDLQMVLNRRRRNSTTHEVPADEICFEFDSADGKDLSTIEDDKFDRSDSSESSPDSEYAEVTGDTEDIEREGQIAVIPMINYDILIYIKMAPYSLSLEDFMWPDQQNTNTRGPIQHCFHTLTTVRILWGILMGVGYLHRRNIIHRDLKPSNVFLSILERNEPATSVHVDISNCKECGTYTSNPTCIIPCIGDFGLVASLKNPTPIPSSGSTTPVNEATPFPFSTQSTQQAGTKFYCPPSIPKAGPAICPKLDVYSMGIIAFELIMKFSTKSERGFVLNDLSKGIFPHNFDSHEMAAGIRKMLCADRDQRWDCADVEKWLTDLQKKLE